MKVIYLIWELHAQVSVLILEEMLITFLFTTELHVKYV